MYKLEVSCLIPIRIHSLIGLYLVKKKYMPRKVILPKMYCNVMPKKMIIPIV